LAEKIERFESGKMSFEEVLEFFSDLNSSGTLPKMTHYYKKTFAEMKEAGLVS